MSREGNQDVCMLCFFGQLNGRKDYLQSAAKPLPTLHLISCVPVHFWQFVLGYLHSKHDKIWSYQKEQKRLENNRFLDN